MSDTTLNQNQNSAVFTDYQARANSFADYAAIAAFAPNLVAKNAKIQAAAEQDLQATEPRLVGTNMSMSNNYFADYSAIAAFASTVNAKNSKIQAAAEQELKATEPQIIGTYEPINKHSFADNGAIAAFVECFANVHAKRESSLSALAEAAENHSKAMAKNKPSFFEKLLNTPITYSFRPNFGGIA